MLGRGKFSARKLPIPAIQPRAAVEMKSQSRLRSCSRLFSALRTLRTLPFDHFPPNYDSGTHPRPITSPYAPARHHSNHRAVGRGTPHKFPDWVLRCVYCYLQDSCEALIASCLEARLPTREQHPLECRPESITRQAVSNGSISQSRAYIAQHATVVHGYIVASIGPSFPLP